MNFQVEIEESFFHNLIAYKKDQEEAKSQRVRPVVQSSQAATVRAGRSEKIEALIKAVSDAQSEVEHGVINRMITPLEQTRTRLEEAPSAFRLTHFSSNECQNSFNDLR